MIVNRRMFYAKKGCMDEAIAVMQAVGKRIGPPFDKARYYRDLIAPFDMFGYEIECENLAQYEQLLADAHAKITAELWDKWHALTGNGGTNEIWMLVE